MNPKVDLYFTDGCGRCPLGGTTNCKVNSWQKEMKHIRRIILDCGLTEELKWGVPCYTFQKSNIAVLAAFKEYCSLSFFKGALLSDSNGILTQPTENTQSARLIRFTSVREILNLEPAIKAHLYEAMEVEKAGLKVDFKKVSELVIPEEFQKKMKEIPALKNAFEALTPGRQKGYLLYFSGAKQSSTRIARIDKYLLQIIKGKGLNDA